jgi:hypothetical protein
MLTFAEFTGTETAATGLTVGDSAAFTCTFAVAVEGLPAQAFDAVSDTVMSLATPVTGAVYVVVEASSGLMVPSPAAGAAQLNVIGVDPVALPFSVIDPPERTVYGPPALATGALQAAVGLMVTVVDTGAEASPAALVAVTVTVMLVAVATPAGAV